MTQNYSKLVRLIRALSKNEAGNTAICLAFIAPSMLMFILGIMEVGRVMWLQNALDYSVVQAARCLSNSPNTCASASQAESFAASEAGTGFDSTVFTVTSASCGNKVTASYAVTLDIPYVNWSTTLSSEACYPT